MVQPKALQLLTTLADTTIAFVLNYIYYLFFYCYNLIHMYIVFLMQCIIVSQPNTDYLLSENCICRF